MLEEEKKNFESMLLSKIENYSSTLKILNKNNKYIAVNKTVIAQVEKGRAQRALIIYTEI